VRLVIPGRPQSRARNAKGQALQAAHAYHESVRHHARQAGLGKDGHPHAPNGFIALWLTFVYASPKLDLPPTAWPAENIPNAHRAPEITLLALEGLAYTRVAQVNPLIVTRVVLTPEECQARYGSADGATVIEIEA
jgi:hypothetical protein